MGGHTPECHAVIGGAYGDEGKGRFTDALIRSASLRHSGGSVVVRFNGGAQAGHTVHDGSKHHVFHHWGSGALAGASTHLGPQMVCHPMVFLSETQSLASMGACTRMRVDPRCRITTPYDVLLNQAAERARDRSGGRHGSCGMGFGETIERCLSEEFALRAGDLDSLSVSALMARLQNIRSAYLPARAQSLGVDRDLTLDFWASSDRIMDSFFDNLMDFKRSVSIVPIHEITAQSHIVFEGAQGLELDEEWGAFPHVTRSKTGVLHATEIMAESGLSHVDVHHMTRAYTTRHGAGPLPYEAPIPDHVSLVDPTNQPNPHQGALRWAPLQPERLNALVCQDLARAHPAVHMTPGWVVTCLDQINPAAVPVVVSGIPTELHWADVQDLLTKRSPLRASTHGSDCAAVVWHDKTLVPDAFRVVP